jgi:O-glycosyl hydrolase
MSAKSKRNIFFTIYITACTTLVNAQNTGHYKVLMNQPQQIIWGLGVEIQNDAIGSGNKGLPDEVIAIPDNLVPSERTRLYSTMLKGFRYCRLAMGLYLRGTDAERKHIVERYPHQLGDLKELIRRSGMEGISMEYWSPAPYWKSTGQYIGGTLKSYDRLFLNDFGDALVSDVNYLKSNGIPISMWGLQNEPAIPSQAYSHCHYSADDYVVTFKAVAPKIRAAIPGAKIMVDSWNGNVGETGKKIREDTSLMKYIDAWVLHRTGADANGAIDEGPALRSNTWNKPVFSNEYEYFKNTNDTLTINTAQNIMNWFTFANSPTWFWLHALKPTNNAEASGFSLGFWRPENDNDYTHSPQIKKGHWDYNAQNFNAIAGFLKYMPWNSQRYTVMEDVVRKDNRIMAYKTPAGKLVIVLTNRSASPFTFQVSTGSDRHFNGYRFTGAKRNVKMKRKHGETISATLAPLSIEFWVEK